MHKTVHKEKGKKKVIKKGIKLYRKSTYKDFKLVKELNVDGRLPVRALSEISLKSKCTSSHHLTQFQQDKLHAEVYKFFHTFTNILYKHKCST